MAIEIKIPKEINRYEAKFVGPFSLRQTICLVTCLPLCIGLYLLTKPYVGTDLAGFFVIPPAGIAYLFGWYKPYGMKFEKYLQSVFINSFLAPSKRPYKTENYYSRVLLDIKKADAAETPKADGTKGKRKNQTKKYKRSKQAIR